VWIAAKNRRKKCALTALKIELHVHVKAARFASSRTRSIRHVIIVHVHPSIVSTHESRIHPTASIAIESGTRFMSVRHKAVLMFSYRNHGTAKNAATRGLKSVTYVKQRKQMLVSTRVQIATPKNHSVHFVVAKPCLMLTLVSTSAFANSANAKLVLIPKPEIKVAATSVLHTTVPCANLVFLDLDKLSVLAASVCKPDCMLGAMLMCQTCEKEAAKMSFCSKCDERSNRNNSVSECPQQLSE
jgi:hypothetical protein